MPSRGCTAALGSQKFGRLRVARRELRYVPIAPFLGRSLQPGAHDVTIALPLTDAASPHARAGPPACACSKAQTSEHLRARRARDEAAVPQPREHQRGRNDRLGAVDTGQRGFAERQPGAAPMPTIVHPHAGMQADKDARGGLLCRKAVAPIGRRCTSLGSRLSLGSAQFRECLSTTECEWRSSGGLGAMALGWRE